MDRIAKTLYRDRLEKEELVQLFVHFEILKTPLRLFMVMGKYHYRKGPDPVKVALFRLNESTDAKKALEFCANDWLMREFYRENGMLIHFNHLPDPAKIPITEADPTNVPVTEAWLEYKNNQLGLH